MSQFQLFQFLQFQIPQLFLMLFLLTGILAYKNVYAVDISPNIMVLDFQLNDMTDLPNAPEELQRINDLTTIYKQKLADHNVEIIPVNEKLKAVTKTQSATYLFDNVETAATLAAGSGADYLLIGVA